jgi:hypothetical protein
MASRLYPATVGLCCPVLKVLGLWGLGACQCRVEEAVKRHGGLSLWTFVVLQGLRDSPEETVGEVKEWWP